MTTRKRSTATTPIDKTLDEHSAEIHADPRWADQLAGGITYAQAVCALYDIRGELDQIDVVNIDVRDDMTRAYEQDNRIIADRELKFTKGKAAHTRRYVPSKAAQSRPAAYEAAKVFKSHFEVAHPARRVERISELEGLYARSTTPALADLLQAREIMSKLRKPLHAEEAECKARLDEIAQITGWNGLPRTYTDEWKVQIAVRQYDADLFAQMHPLLFEELAITKEYPAGDGYLIFGKREPREVDDNFTGYRSHNGQRTYFENGEISELDEIEGE